MERISNHTSTLAGDDFLRNGQSFNASEASEAKTGARTSICNNVAGTRPCENSDLITRRVKCLPLNISGSEHEVPSYLNGVRYESGSLRDATQRYYRPAGRQAARVCVSTLRLTPADGTGR